MVHVVKQIDERADCLRSVHISKRHLPFRKLIVCNLKSILDKLKHVSENVGHTHTHSRRHQRECVCTYRECVNELHARACGHRAAFFGSKVVALHIIVLEELVELWTHKYCVPGVLSIVVHYLDNLRVKSCKKLVKSLSNKSCAPYISSLCVDESLQFSVSSKLS